MLIRICILFTICECIRYYPRSRSHLDYYPFGPHKYPTTPIERLYHDLELIKEAASNSSKTKSHENI